ncbi:MAG TPA: hypothetical protein VJO13_21035 [Ktedonobacterales bacterium]|nr:hypothetical protein [Ktedonobacterales bacterium]
MVEQASRDVERAAIFDPSGRWRRLQPWGIALLVALYCGLWNLAARLPLHRTDLDAFFVPASRIALSGHPFDVYSLRYQGDYPNANGPISLIPLTLASAIASWQGMLNDIELRRVVVMTIFAPFVLLMAREAVAAVDQLRDKRLMGVWRFAAYALFALSPEIWHSMLFYGHIEQPIMLWLSLWGIRQLTARRPARAGLLLGLALLTRSSALMLVLPLAALLARDRQWRALARFGAAMVGTVGVVLLPFLLADRSHVIYSLVTFRGRLPVGGGSFWGLTLNTPLESFGQRYDGFIVLLVSLLLTGIVLLRRRDLTLASPALYLLLALSSFCFALFIKTLWPYYFLEPFTFLTIWWLGAMPSPVERYRSWLRWGMAIILPAIAVACASMREYGLTVEQENLDAFKPESIVLSLTMALAMGVILWLLLVRPSLRAKSALQAAAYADTVTD